MSNDADVTSVPILTKDTSTSPNIDIELHDSSTSSSLVVDNFVKENNTGNSQFSSTTSPMPLDSQEIDLHESLDKFSGVENLNGGELSKESNKDINNVNDNYFNGTSYDQGLILQNINEDDDSSEKYAFHDKDSYEKNEFKKKEKKTIKHDESEVIKSLYEKKNKLEKEKKADKFNSLSHENSSTESNSNPNEHSPQEESTLPTIVHQPDDSQDYGNGVYELDDKKSKKKFNKKSDGKPLADIGPDDVHESPYIDVATETGSDSGNEASSQSPVTGRDLIKAPLMNETENSNEGIFMEKETNKENDSEKSDDLPPKESTTKPITDFRPLEELNNYETSNVSSVDIMGLHDKTLPIGFSKCASGQFQCTNGTTREGAYCVPLSAKCDSINDCSDGSDEARCIEEGCPGNFQCANGQCLKRHLVCNSIVDCNDGSDEKNCDEWKCHFDELQCPSGRCVPVLWQCDGKPDCDNHTDEFNCQTTCGNNEYLCPEGWCIPQTWRCNGEPECANGEDEKLCDCSVDQFRCNTGGCIDAAQVCDGVEQCPDNSDEWDCVQLDAMDLQIRTKDNKWLPVCSEGWTPEWSHTACQGLGFAKAQFTEMRAADNVTRHFTLKPDARWDSGHRLTAAVNQSNQPCESFVEITCQEFTCGNPGPSEGVAARLVGGNSAANGQWPSVAILYQNKTKASCTASIISPRWLLSSYNCLHSRDKSLTSEGWVAFGGGSMFETDKPETQVRVVSEMVPYPQVKFNRFLYSDDVVLVALKEPFSLTRYVGAICLPEKEIEPRQLCVTAGWGYTSPGEINFSQYLHYLPVPTIDLAECNSTKHYAGFVSQHEICAGFTDAEKTPCYKDEGAPLMCVSEGGVWELQGVLSYHSHCGRGFHPSIYSSVAAVRSWIERTVGSRFERKSTFNVRRR